MDPPPDGMRKYRDNQRDMASMIETAVVPPENLIPDSALDACAVMKRPMVAVLTQLLLAIRSRFTRRARLEAENLFCANSFFSSDRVWFTIRDPHRA